MNKQEHLKRIEKNIIKQEDMINSYRIVPKERYERLEILKKVRDEILKTIK